MSAVHEQVKGTLKSGVYLAFCSVDGHMAWLYVNHVLQSPNHVGGCTSVNYPSCVDRRLCRVQGLRIITSGIIPFTRSNCRVGKIAWRCHSMSIVPVWSIV